MIVNDRVIFQNSRGKELKGFLHKILKSKSGQVNYIIFWDDGTKIQYTEDKIHLLKKDIQYHRNIKIDQIILNQPEKNFPI
jgi:hypothetical protein